MSDLIHTIKTGLERLATMHTEDDLGDRTTYLGASEIGLCPRRVAMSKLDPRPHKLEDLLRFKRGHVAEDILAEALAIMGFTFKRQFEIEVQNNAGVPVKVHLDLLFVSHSMKVAKVLEVKSPWRLPDAPYESQIIQAQIQAEAVSQVWPGYDIEVGIININLGDEGIRFFDGYSPNPTLFVGLMERARSIWSDYQKALSGEVVEFCTEVSTLCFKCGHLGSCSRFQADEVPELAGAVEVLTEQIEQSKSLEADVKDRKKKLLKIVQATKPFTAGGKLLRAARNSSTKTDSERLSAFLETVGSSLEEFQVKSPYTYLDIRDVA